MSYYSKAAPGLNKRIADALNVNSDIIRSEIYGVLERNREGRGAVYTTYFRTSPSGTVYPIGKRPRPHKASAEGDPPARDTGRLMESIAVVKQATPTDLTADTGPRIESFRGRKYYPAFLEYGTRKIAPRPFMQPAASLARKALRRKGLKVA